ncbi:MAG: hypothetical protein Q7S06_00425 [Nanoarchaeota archaeon]|nr:hypothetical protein [Nanoarchaeota archaeon]
MSKQEIKFATSLIWIKREIAHHKYKIDRSEWKRTGSSFHALFQKVNDKKETLFLGKNNEEKYRRYFA